jgi:hypothetical protein
MQEQVNDKTVALSIKSAKITGKVLAQAMQIFLKNAHAPPKGKQSVKSLTKHGASLANIEITGNNIGSFSKYARKYNIDFALKKDTAAEKPTYIVFFKTKDKDALDSAFTEFSRFQQKYKKKTPILKKLKRYIDISKAQAPPAKHRERGER